jgi:chemotaxis protein MotB
MALPGRRQRRLGIDIWPGFVDALSQLLIIIIFVVLIFTAAQFYLTRALSGSESRVDELSRKISELANQLSLAQKNENDLSVSLAQTSRELQASIAARDQMQATIADLAARVDESRSTARNQLEDKDTALRQKETALSTSQNLVGLLNQQIAALREQLSRLAAALDLSEQKTKDQDVQIADLGKRLNAALASKVQELASYRSEFFGRLREILGDRPDIRIVGDRFVFQSEVLFQPGSAELGPEARQELNLLGGALRDIAAKIPAEIPWVLRVDGHTDKRPISTLQFPSNWELSTARATAVVKYLIDQGIPAERLAAAGFGEFQPIDAATSDDAYRKNRRIEFKLTER